jgi:hypothetical protein
VRRRRRGDDHLDVPFDWRFRHELLFAGQKNKKTSSCALTFLTAQGGRGCGRDHRGTVTAGLFKGHKVTGQIKFAPKAGQNCAPGHPVRNITFFAPVSVRARRFP